MKKLLLCIITIVLCVCLSAPVFAEEIIASEEDWVDKFFSPDKVAMYVSWIAYIGTILGLVANIKKLKQTNNLTLKNVSDEVQNVLQVTIGKEVANKFGEVIPKVISTQEKTNQIMTIFAKILALSQENTPEGKIAVLNLIEELGCVSKDVIDEAKDVITTSVELAEETKKQIEEKIDEIVEGYDGTSI